MNNQKKFSLLKTIIIVLVAYFIITKVLGLFQNNSDYSNSYLENHTVTYNDETSTEEVNHESLTGIRNKFTKIKGNGEDDVTIMVYMIGTDLESEGGMATADINEMLKSNIEGNINVVLQTGGCKRWANSVISSSTIERYTINAEGLLRLQSNVGNTSMTDPGVLTSFIRYSVENFPANRYMLILWDHGGGSATGYGYDEKFPSSGSMSPDVIAKALKNSNVKFDFVGFDACLMANLETAIAIEPYADYLIGSEESEPGTGWNYVNWLKAVDRNTSIQTLDLAKIIIDDYITSSKRSTPTAEITQSIVDLGELVYAIEKPLEKFSKATSKTLSSNNYQKIAIARSNTKEFSKSSRLDQVDLIDLAEKFAVDGSNELVSAVKNAVKYNKTYNINNSYGLSAYFPYSALSKVNSMVRIYDNIDMEPEYTGMVKSFATYASSGQVASQNSGATSSSLLDLLLNDSYNSSYDNYYSQDNLYDIFNDSYYGDSSYYGYGDIYGDGYSSWMEPSAFDILASLLRNNHLDKLNIVTKNSQKVVKLTEKQWSLVNNVLLNVFVDDGKGYIDLGKDNVFEFNKDGDLIVDYDGTWLSINNHVVSYSMISDEYINQDKYKIVGKIPAYLNEQKVDIIVNFTNQEPYGKVIGAKAVYKENDIQQKGFIEIKDGDVIKFIADYYRYDGTLVDQYQIGETLVVNGPLVLNNVYIDNNYVYAYCFTDIYGNNLWTEKTVVKK